MESIDYSEHLPQPHVPAKDAIFALTDKIPGFAREGFFDTEKFVEVFRDRFVHIVNSLPQDESRKELEVELAHIQHALNLEHGLILFADEVGGTLRAIEEDLTEAGVFEDYKKFSDNVINTNLVIDSDLFERYLYYLYEYAQYSIEHAFIYLRTLERFSQVDGADGTIYQHLGNIWKTYQQDIVDSLLEQHNYLGGAGYSYGQHIHLALSENDDFFRHEASDSVDRFREENARFHMFLISFWNNAITPHMKKLSKVQQTLIVNLLNTLRDFIDPEHFVPMFFGNGYYPETMMREKILSEGRRIH